jgi:hypothetical protein
MSKKGQIDGLQRPTLPPWTCSSKEMPQASRNGNLYFTGRSLIGSEAESRLFKRCRRECSKSRGKVSLAPACQASGAIEHHEQGHHQLVAHQLPSGTVLG